MAEPLVLTTRSAAETHRLGMRLGAELSGGERIGLSGELGAGKTCLVRGVAEGLGIAPEAVRSPSFTLLATYEGGRLPLHHIDLFRLGDGVDAEDLREILYGDGVCAVEWFERLADGLEDFLEISLTFVGPRARRLVAAARGVRYDRLIAILGETHRAWR